MQKHRWLAAPQQPGELYLPARRVEQILAAHDKGYVLLPVVNRRRELVRPVAFAILREQIAALHRRLLLLPPEPQVVEPLEGVFQADADPEAR